MRTPDGGKAGEYFAVLFAVGAAVGAVAVTATAGFAVPVVPPQGADGQKDNEQQDAADNEIH